jgi:WD40 repeat protein
LYFIDIKSGRVRANQRTTHESVYSLYFVRDGRSVRAILGDATKGIGEILDCDLVSGGVLSARNPGLPMMAGPVAISADGRWIASAKFGGSAVRVRDLDSGQLVAELGTLNTASALSPGMAFSPDGSILAVGREDGSIELWDIRSKRTRSVLRGLRPSYESWGLRFSPDGRWLGVRSEYGRPVGVIQHAGWLFQSAVSGRNWRRGDEVVVFDLRTGRVHGRAGGSIHPDFAPDGRTLATRNGDFSASLFDLPPAP